MPIPVNSIPVGSTQVIASKAHVPMQFMDTTSTVQYPALTMMQLDDLPEPSHSPFSTLTTDMNEHRSKDDDVLLLDLNESVSDENTDDIHNDDELLGDVLNNGHHLGATEPNYTGANKAVFGVYSNVHSIHKRDNRICNLCCGTGDGNPNEVCCESNV